MKPLEFNLSGPFQSAHGNPALLGGRYKIIDHLGSGGFGQTFLAEDIHLPNHPRCVVKQLKPQISDEAGLKIAQRLFDTEAKVLYKLGDHNQIPLLLAHFKENQEFYLAQELIEGTSLSEELETNQIWPQAKVVALLHDVLTVLAFVHDQQVIHRDIKPSNLIRRYRDGRLVLIDFGAVKQVSTQLVSTQPGATNLTVSIGTKGYMPNEQLGGNPRFCSDLYALGMICIQGLTGMHPQYLDEDPRTGEALWRDLAPELDPVLADILDGMVRYDFRERYSNAALALQHLSRLPSNLRQAALAFQQPITPAAAKAAPPKSFSSPVGRAAQSSKRQASAPASVRGRQAGVSVNDAQPNVALAGGKPRQTGARGLILLASLAAVLGLSGLGGRAFLPSLLANQTASNSDTLATGSPDEASLITTQAFANSARLVSIVTLNSQANALQATHHYDEALNLYNQVANLNPKDEAVHLNRCNLANQLGQYDQAIAACDQALDLNPDNSQVVWNKGYALEQLDQPQQALELYDQAIALAPNFADAWNSKGTVLQKLDKLNQAIDAFDQAITLDPNLTEAQTNKETAVVRQRQETEVARQEAAAAARRVAAASQPVATAREIQQEAQRAINDVNNVRDSVNDIRRLIGR